MKPLLNTSPRNTEVRTKIIDVKRKEEIPLTSKISLARFYTEDARKKEN